MDFKSVIKCIYLSERYFDSFIIDVYLDERKMGDIVSSRIFLYFAVKSAVIPDN